MRYLVDTDWLIDALVGIPEAVATLEDLTPDGLGISIISVGEVYEGAHRGSDPEVRLARYRMFLAPFPVLSLTDPIMERFARTRAALRRQGELIPDLDLLIAATVLDHDLTLLTRNRRHFLRIPGLMLYENS
jgi:predicted nucleic acid-binding protein